MAVQADMEEWELLNPDNVNEDPLNDKEEEALRLQVMNHANRENNGRLRILEMQQTYGLHWLSMHRIACVNAEQWRYSCDYCNKEFIGITQLAAHIESVKHKKWIPAPDERRDLQQLFILKDANQ